MGFMDTVKTMATDAGKSALGIVEKAKLILHTVDSPELNDDDFMGQTMSILFGDSPSLPSPSVGTHILEVQYNPASISLQANAQPVPFQYLQSNIDSGIPAQNMRDPSVVLTVDLYFDDMNTKDAFMIDKLRLSAGDIVTAGAGIARAIKGKSYSVMPQTNGIIAALIRDETRTVTFKWSDMSFTGELSEVSANYTMFSVSGRPVRSCVNLRITQQVSASGDTSYWTRAFDGAFGSSADAASSGGRSFADRYGNLLNIGF